MKKNRLLAALAALVVVLGLAGLGGPATARVGNSGDTSCTTGTFSGNANNGSWSRTYNPGCSDTTKASITITWKNYKTTNGDRHISWDATVSTGPIAGNDCVQIALDWNNPLGGHSDNQIMRNCYENSTRTMNTQDIDTADYDITGLAWPVQRMQLSTYDPDTQDVRNVVCPGEDGAPGLTQSGPDCVAWQSHGSAAFNSFAAKVYLRTNGGQDQQNAPTYPNNYGIVQQTSPQS